MLDLIMHRALTPPGYKKEYHIGVRSEKSGMLLGFISAVPQKIHVRKNVISMVEVRDVAAK